jgi:hypothetical protein
MDDDDDDEEMDEDDEAEAEAMSLDAPSPAPTDVHDILPFFRSAAEELSQALEWPRQRSAVIDILLFLSGRRKVVG